MWKEKCTQQCICLFIYRSISVSDCYSVITLVFYNALRCISQSHWRNTNTQHTHIHMLVQYWHTLSSFSEDALIIQCTTYDPIYNTTHYHYTNTCTHNTTPLYTPPPLQQCFIRLAMFIGLKVFSNIGYQLNVICHNGCNTTKLITNWKIVFLSSSHMILQTILQFLVCCIHACDLKTCWSCSHYAFNIYLLCWIFYSSVPMLKFALHSNY